MIIDFINIQPKNDTTNSNDLFDKTLLVMRWNIVSTR